mmetsp:Transcript_27256/g.38558  ORF Transcript_27256/g.38558 Transcript_27256/m.38558 type:complete len:736 (-) Transcript_27256:225-2432(-)
MFRNKKSSPLSPWHCASCPGAEGILCQCKHKPLCPINPERTLCNRHCIHCRGHNDGPCACEESPRCPVRACSTRCTPAHYGYPCSQCRTPTIVGNRYECRKTDDEAPIQLCEPCLFGFLTEDAGLPFRQKTPVNVIAAPGDEPKSVRSKGSDSQSSVPLTVSSGRQLIPSLCNSSISTETSPDQPDDRQSHSSHSTRYTSSVRGMTPENTTKMYSLAIVGGGPVGLSFALRLIADSKKFKISVFERRWRQNHETARLEWRDERERNNRRYQVVTIQSNVWSRLPEALQHALFGEDGNGPHHVEMWPYGPDSPREVGSPRNIPIMTFEDILLDEIQSNGEVELIPRRMEDEDAINFDIVVLAEGSGRSTEERLFNGVLGNEYVRRDGERQSGTGPFNSIPGGGSDLQEYVLGIYVEAPDGEDAIGISEADGMALTVSQNRFLLNPLGRKKGYLNVWLTNEEAKQAVGVTGDGTFTPVECSQSQQCMWRVDHESSECRCESHGSLFLPAYLNRSITEYPLWERIKEGIDLFGINMKHVRRFTKFRLGPFRQRQLFSALGDSRTKRPHLFTIGDSAFNVSFRAGRGLNTGLKGAISLSTALSQAGDKAQSMRQGDFVVHEGFMCMLQQREVHIRTIGMMKIPTENAREATVPELIGQGLSTSDKDVDEHRKELMRRLRKIVDGPFTVDRLPDGTEPPNLGRLSTKIGQLSPSLVIVMSKSGGWNTSAVGGLEPQPNYP